MEIIFSIVVIIGLVRLLGFLGNLFGLSSNSSETLRVKIAIEQLPGNPGGSSDQPELWRAIVNGHGSVGSPPIGYPVALIQVLDVTDKGDFKPILCPHDEWADGDGIFRYKQEIQTPHAVTNLNGSTIGIVPLSVLIFPRQGRRKLRIFVTIAGDKLTAIEEDIYFENPMDGYLDQQDKIQNCEVLIAKLAVAASAVDGAVDKVEISIIKKFFSDRLSGGFECEKRKQKVTDALQEAARVMASPAPSDIFREIQELTNKLVNFDDSGISEVAFDLCLQVIVADGKIEVAERKLVELLRSQLNITVEIAKNIEDRLLRIDLYVEDDIGSQLGMPSGFSSAQQKSWLAKEYGKWKNRVTHSDPEKSMEAEVRLNLIAKYRSKLD